jgi:hypothetical protein
VLRLREDDLAIQPAGDEVVLLCLRSSAYFSVNPTGAVLLDRLRTGGASHDELTAALVDEFHVDPAAAALDVDAFVLELAAAGLLAA